MSDAISPEDGPIVCPICQADLDDDGKCPTHGGPSEWKDYFEQQRADSIRAQQQEEEL